MAVIKLISALLLLSVPSIAEQPQIPLSSPSEECVHPDYNIHIFSTSPLVLYITNFLTPTERAHLLDITKETFAPSLAADSTGNTGHQQTRTSQSTNLPHDPIVQCIESRALSIQGHPSPTHLEPLQLVSYTQNQSYHYHTDWFPSLSLSPPSHGFNRLYSIFAYVHVSPSLTGGGTNFPILNAPKGERGEKWCEWVDCDEEWEKGVTFRPVEGNAVFWANMVEDQRGLMVGDERVLHAGLPVTGGRKVGMNIWTREGAIDEKYRD